MSGLRRLGEICRVVRVVAYSQWVHDIKVETLARCGTGWQPARRLATAAVRCQRGIWPIDNRPDPEGTPAKLPTKAPAALRTHTLGFKPFCLVRAVFHFAGDQEG